MKRNKLSFLITKEELKCLEDISFLEPYLIDNIKKAKAEAGMYRIEFYPYDLRDVLRALSYVKDYMHSYGEREDIYRLHSKIKEILTLN
ncbi:MAG: hypothetical protein ABH836_06800 [Candidatus Omnitrophota bacterium]